MISGNFQEIVLCTGRNSESLPNPFLTYGVTERLEGDGQFGFTTTKVGDSGSTGERFFDFSDDPVERVHQPFPDLEELETKFPDKS